MASDWEEQATEAVRKRHEKMKNTTVANFVAVDNTERFVDGRLLTVRFENQTEEGGTEYLFNYVYFVDDQPRVLKNELEVIDELRRRKVTWIAEFLTVTRVAGFIAVVIVLTLIFMLFISSDSDERKILVQAMTAVFSLILGFFFGKAK